MTSAWEAPSTRPCPRVLDSEVSAYNPGLRAAYGVGPDTAAQLLVTAGANPERMRTKASFTALCGVAPVPASSGRTNRHRLSQGGDRDADAALYRIALVRTSSDSTTRAYTARQTAAGRTKKEIIRLLKRAMAREMFRYRHRPRRRRPVAPASSQEHHPHGRRSALRCLAHHHLQT
ncbi:transposase [Streptomyces shenzhenensis]|uniref:Transposase IS116/IS110/IS902 C-terminal domain-containing protein n=1 Tax=Streptomyces shenzhenensis TaxID=943815 RepID=A0A3M0I4A4_9ACTN|nr:hypothetical protein CTZ28_17295 [Streptomyces shenzhenensis]